MAAIEVASLYGVLSLRDTFTPDLQKAEQATQGFGRRLQTGLDNIGGSMQRVGGMMTASITTPIVAGLGYSVNAAMDFNRQMSNVHSVLGITGDEAERLSDAVLELGGNTVAGPLANSAAIYDVVSAGITDQALALEMLAAANAVAEAGQADLGAVTSGLISTVNAYGLTIADIPRLQDIFTRTVQMGVLSMDEMASAFPQVTGLAAQFGLEADDMASSLAFLTTQGFSASQSATFLRGMITTLLNPTADLQESIVALGYDSGQSLLETEGLVGAYQLLAEQNGGLAGLITNQEALIGALALTKEGADDFADTFINGIDGATEAARAINNETAGFEQLQSKLSALAITVGNELTPVLLDFANNTLTPAIDAVLAWADANPEATQTVLGLTLAAAAAGPVIGTLGTIFKGLAAVVGFLPLVFTPLGGVLALSAGLVAAYTNNWLGFRDAVDTHVIPALSRAEDAIQMFGIIALGGISQAAIASRQILGALGIEIDNLGAQWDRTAARISRSAQSIVDDLMGVERRLGRNEDNISPILDEANNTSGRFNGGLGFNLPPYLQEVGIGARADGGPVMAGQPYVVGERGMELFVPQQSGAIVPNHAMGGMTNNFYITQREGESGEALAQRIGWALRRMG